jgi:hypothetical protein
MAITQAYCAALTLDQFHWKSRIQSVTPAPDGGYYPWQIQFVTQMSDVDIDRAAALLKLAAIRSQSQQDFARDRLAGLSCQRRQKIELTGCQMTSRPVNPDRPALTVKTYFWP